MARAIIQRERPTNPIASLAQGFLQGRQQRSQSDSASLANQLTRSQIAEQQRKTDALGQPIPEGLFRDLVSGSVIQDPRFIGPFQQETLRQAKEKLERESAEAQRIAGLSAQYESGAIQAPDGTAFNPIDRNLVRTIAGTNINIGGGSADPEILRQLGFGGAVTVPKVNQQAMTPQIGQSDLEIPSDAQEGDTLDYYNEAGEITASYKYINGELIQM